MGTPRSRNRTKSPATIQARPVVARLLWIADQLRAGKKINAGTHAAKWEMARKTAQRDFDFLRDRMGYELEWDNVRNTYELLYAPEPRL